MNRSIPARTIILLLLGSLPASIAYAAPSIERIVSDLPERPRLAATEMIAKYGEPQEATAERLVWHNAGPYKRIVITREETPHDFPKPHMDFLQHTINYRVPPEKISQLTNFDGSVTVNRTEGELAAKCDLEGHNILSLNLANDIVQGKKSVSEARTAFNENVRDDELGKDPAYLKELQFKVSEMPAADADKPTIPGSPVRGIQQNREARGMLNDERARTIASDAEALGFVVAIDENEILAASVAAKKNLRPEVLEYAKMLHQDHGENVVATLKVGENMGVKPVETAAVDALRVKGAGELAELVPLDGKEFESAFLKAMIDGHKEALQMIDDQLSSAHDERLKQHLSATRNRVSSHLEMAKNLSR